MHSFFKPGGAKLAADKKEERNAEKPWVEKYRPKSVDDVAHQDEVVSVLKKSLKDSNLQNLLFYGPPGSGKTSTILALAHQLYGREMFKERVLELNASDERGIDVVREKVKQFSQLTANNRGSGDKSCPLFKLVILDEADSMTKSSQEALRRTMETSTKTTRFCLICNYVSRIIAPIASRCSQFRFKPLSTENQRKRLKFVCEKENVDIAADALESLVLCSEGDLRKSMTFLQTAHCLKGKDGITREDILEITGVIKDDVITSLLDSCASNDYDVIKGNVTNIIQDGHAASQVISQLHDEVLSMKLSDDKKSEIMEAIAVIDKKLLDGADEYLQLMSLVTKIQLRMNTN